MDRQSELIFEKHTDFILGEATAFFGTSPDKLERLGSFESVVYEYEKDKKRYILKITHSLHRSTEEVQGELEWNRYLAEGGVEVSPAVRSQYGRLVERVEVEDSYFLVYVFEKARGNPPEIDNGDLGLFETWGRTLGQMHRRTKTFEPSRNIYRRKHWHEEMTMNLERYIPDSLPLVREKCGAVKKRLQELTQDNNEYGLVHGDLHHGNFFVNNGHLTVFDFDDCLYHWFAYDIGIPLFYLLQDARIKRDDTEYALKFMTAFTDGYKRENRLEREWLELLPLFMKVREMELYFILLELDPGEWNGWCRRYMVGRQESIEQGKPIVEIDFTRFA